MASDQAMIVVTLIDIAEIHEADAISERLKYAACQMCRDDMRRFHVASGAFETKDSAFST